MERISSSDLESMRAVIKTSLLDHGVSDMPNVLANDILGALQNQIALLVQAALDNTETVTMTEASAFLAETNQWRSRVSEALGMTVTDHGVREATLDEAVARITEQAAAHVAERADERFVVIRDHDGTVTVDYPETFKTVAEVQVDLNMAKTLQSDERSPGKLSVARLVRMVWPA